MRWLFMLAGDSHHRDLVFFPARHLFDARPIITADHAVHYEQCLRSRAVFWQTFRLDCYNPYFMAGYPAGTVFDVDMKGAELFTALIPIHTATALKLFILIAYLSMLPSCVSRRAHAGLPRGRSGSRRDAALDLLALGVARTRATFVMSACSRSSLQPTQWST
jgi:hypothetical protein